MTVLTSPSLPSSLSHPLFITDHELVHVPALS